MKGLIQKILRQFHGEQNLEKLIERGLAIGKNVKIMGGVIIDPSHCWHIKIGNDVTLAPRVHILAHDASTKAFLGYTKVANVVIGNRVFIGAGSIVLPGVVIGDDVVIGAGSVVSHDIPSNSVALGCPARVIKSVDDYLENAKNKMHNNNVFDERYTLRNPEFGMKEREELLVACERWGQVFVE
jgi:maltose O-acetyltransferase